MIILWLGTCSNKIYSCNYPTGGHIYTEHTQLEKSDYAPDSYVAYILLFLISVATNIYKS